FKWAKTKKKSRPIVLMLEIKGIGFEQKITDLVEQYGIEEDIVVICFRLDELKKIRELKQDVGLFWIDGNPRPAEKLVAHAEKRVRQSIVSNVQLNPLGQNN